MNRTTMSYMVATLVSLAVLGTIIMQPTLVAATMSNTDPSSDSSTTNPACGQVVSGNVTLTSNLNCAGDGLIVGDDNTVINMNGRSITGPGSDSSKVGIMIPATANVAVVGPGSINGYQAAILATGNQGLQVSRLVLTTNQIGVFLTGSSKALIQENIMSKNKIGTAVHSARGVDVENNVISANSLAGFTGVNAFGSTISGNNIQGSNDGIFFDPQSHDNVIDSNIAKLNTEDINNGNGLPLNINHNNFKDNLCTLSTPSGICKGSD
jgi:parallel beta-helix repeat protein